MANNEISMSNVEAIANRIAASTALYETGGKTARFIQCFDQVVEQDQVLVAGYDWDESGTRPIITFAREDGLTRRRIEQVNFDPEVVPTFLAYLDEAFPDILTAPSGGMEAPAVAMALKAFPNGDLGDVYLATLTKGLHRGLLLVQEQWDELSLPFSHLGHLAQGLKNAYQAYVEHPYC